MKFLQLLILVCLASFAFANVIIDEGFEGGVLPTGWETWEEGDTSPEIWCVELGTTNAHTGTYYLFQGWTDTDLDDWCVTDTYDCSTYDTVTYSFWYRVHRASDYEYTGLLYSTTADPTTADFIEIIELGNTATDYTEFTGDISAQCAGEANITFALRYASSYGHVVYIDDVLIEGSWVTLDQDTWGAIKSTF